MYTIPKGQSPSGCSLGINLLFSDKSRSNNLPILDKSRGNNLLISDKSRGNNSLILDESRGNNCVGRCKITSKLR